MTVIYLSDFFIQEEQKLVNKKKIDAKILKKSIYMSSFIYYSTTCKRLMRYLESPDSCSKLKNVLKRFIISDEDNENNDCLGATDQIICLYDVAQNILVPNNNNNNTTTIYLDPRDLMCVKVK